MTAWIATSSKFPVCSFYINVFKEMGLMTIDSKDRVHVFFDKLTHHLPQKEYVEAIIKELGRRVETDFENPNTLFRGFVFSIEKDQLASLRQEVKDIYEKYMSKASSDPKKNIILQSLIGMFPVLR